MLLLIKMNANHLLSSSTVHYENSSSERRIQVILQLTYIHITEMTWQTIILDVPTTHSSFMHIRYFKGKIYKDYIKWMTPSNLSKRLKKAGAVISQRAQAA